MKTVLTFEADSADGLNAKLVEHARSILRLEVEGIVFARRTHDETCRCDGTGQLWKWLEDKTGRALDDPRNFRPCPGHLVELEGTE